MEVEKQGYSLWIPKENNQEPETLFINRCQFIIDIFLKKKIDYSKLLKLSHIWSNMIYLDACYSKTLVTQLKLLTKNTKYYNAIK